MGTEPYDSSPDADQAAKRLGSAYGNYAMRAIGGPSFSHSLSTLSFRGGTAL